jgi:adenosine 3'-phospho 5'-phosphosulfate transporter B2
MQSLLSKSDTLSSDDDDGDDIEQLADKEDDKNCVRNAMNKNPEFFKQGIKLACCFFGLQASYLTWGYMQELIMTSDFEPTVGAPDGRFPSAAFCVFSNRFLAVIVAIISVRIKHGSVLANNTAPLSAFTPAAISNTVSSWSQYASLRYVSFPVQTVFKSSKIIAVMIMGKILKGSTYPYTQYVEALLITCGMYPTLTKLLMKFLMCVFVCAYCNH